MWTVMRQDHIDMHVVAVDSTVCVCVWINVIAGKEEAIVLTEMSIRLF